MMNIGPNENSQDFDLNLAPIIDCFTVLITFMLASASFLSIGILDAGAGVATEAPKDQPPPAIAVQVDLQPSYQMKIKITGKATRTTPIGPKGGSWDYDSLQTELGRIKQQWPETTSLILSAEDTVEYKDVVIALERIHRTIPGVLLGGF